ncbi:hypothetical protein D3C72_2106910 [compost metagenome]
MASGALHAPDGTAGGRGGNQKTCLMPIIEPHWFSPGRGFEPGEPPLTDMASWPPLLMKPAVAYTEVRLLKLYIARSVYSMAWLSLPW